MSHNDEYVEEAKPVSHRQWQALLHAKMQKQMTDRWVAEHTPMCMPPKPTHIAVRRALGIAVYAFVMYPMPSGKPEVTYERIA